MRKLVIAVDFDGTLCEHQFPDEGPPNTRLISALNYIKKRRDCHLILWTCREGEDLERAIEFCRIRDLVFDSINSDGGVTKWEPGRKVMADIFIDDKSFTPDSFCTMFDSIKDSILI